MLALQFIGAGFGIFMLFLTWYYYKKNTYTYRSLSLWFVIWIAFIVFTLFPTPLQGIVQTLQITRILDVFVIGGLFVFSTLVFYLYVIVKNTEKRIEDLVSKLAKEK